MKRCSTCRAEKELSAFSASRSESDGLQRRCKGCNRAYRERNRARIARYMNALPPEYRVWHCMKNRCLNPRAHNFAYYGGRGVTVCERWLKFENFFSDMGPRPSRRHSIDRIDNSRGYEPGNCRWATMKEQCANRRPYGTALRGESAP